MVYNIKLALLVDTHTHTHKIPPQIVLLLSLADLRTTEEGSQSYKDFWKMEGEAMGGNLQSAGLTGCRFVCDDFHLFVEGPCVQQGFGFGACKRLRLISVVN